MMVQRHMMVAMLLMGLPPIAASADDDVLPLLRTFVDELVLITPGEGVFPQSFEMGSTANALEQPVHRVTLDGSFAISRYEVPQNLYEAVMAENPSRWKGPRNSAEMMSWEEAGAFCRKLTEQLREAELIGMDEVIRLPSEAEWEYCCRAGTTTAYSFGESATAEGDAGKQATLLDPYGWHTGNAAGNDPPVGALRPNPWGLYDMHGYLRELTADGWQDGYTDTPADGSAREVAKGEGRSVRVAVRGGSWKDRYEDLRSASRKPMGIDERDDAVGIRCVKAQKDAK